MRKEFLNQDDAERWESIGGRMRKLRTTTGMTQTEVAVAAGMRQQQYARYEGDVAQPRLSVLRRIARALNAKLSKLTGE